MSNRLRPCAAWIHGCEHFGSIVVRFGKKKGYVCAKHARYQR
jgi:hypothetical protein